MALTITDGINFNQGGQVKQDPITGVIQVVTGTPSVPGRTFDFGADGSFGNSANPVESIEMLSGKVANTPIDGDDLVNKAALDSAIDNLPAIPTATDIANAIASALGDSGWIAPALQGSWVQSPAVNSMPPGYRKVAGMVHLRGLLSGGAQGTTMFTLPVGYRPKVGSTTYNAVMIANGYQKLVTLTVTAAGVVSFSDSSSTSTLYVSLTGLSFPAE